MERLIKERLPRHVAVIMDGNGRWAEKRSLSRIEGHKQGVKAIRDTVETARRLGINVLTLYAFSRENWKRPKREVTALMRLLKEYLKRELQEMLDNDIRLVAMGNLEDLPPDVRKTLRETIHKTRSRNGMILNLAVSYSGRAELLRAVKRICQDNSKGKLRAQEITSEVFSRYLFTNGLPDPDLLIRTSGEFRLSNFLLWQIAYTEIYVTDVLWPDFRKKDFIKALLDYQKRERRFGLTRRQLTG
ncbi:MAG: isoprenyl transferase [Deltaproteobacteria bacterium]|nr:MAG: isoprenyl transferase [Deltaproteobacteria bacterium]